MARTIAFVFNQLNGSEIATGGDVKSKIILDHFSDNKDFTPTVIVPRNFKKHFSGHMVHQTGINFLEKLNKSQNPFFVTILFLIRAIQTFFIFLNIKPQVIYSTGDFFCNVIPASFYKIIYPNTIFVSCVFHINQSPLKRQSNTLMRNVFSFFFQQLSFFFLKYFADTIFLLNHQVMRYFMDIKNIPENKLVVSYAGINFNHIQKSVIHIKSKNNWLVYFGRLNPTKGVFDLPQVFSQVLKEHPGHHLHLIGSVDNKTKEKLKKEFKKYGCDKSVTFHGFIKHKKDVYQIIASSKAAVFPSYEEGWNISLFETIACSCPVVTYDLPIYKEVFDGNLKTAPLGDKIALASQLSLLLKNPNQRYSKNLLSIVRKYDWDQVYKIEKESISNL